MKRREFLALTGIGLAGAVVVGYAPRSNARPDAQKAGTSSLMDAAAYRAMRRYAKTPFGDIAYVERGRGAAALFVHGYLLNGFQWRGALERLSPCRRCIALVLMGLGYTEVAQGQSVTPDAQVAMMVAFLDALSIPKVDIVASDSGGQAAQLLLVRHPDRIRSLLLTNCDTESDSPPAALKKTLEWAHAGVLPERMIAPWIADKDRARREYRDIYTYPTNPTDEANDYYFPPLISSPRRRELVQAYTIGLERNPLIGIGPLLKRSTVPARIVWGTGDTIFSAAGPDYLDRNFGHSMGVRWLEHAKLFFAEEMPDVIAQEARRLWGIG